MRISPFALSHHMVSRKPQQSSTAASTRESMACPLHRYATSMSSGIGPQQSANSPYAAVIPRFIESALAGRPVRVFGDGSQTRDFTYVDNVVEANLSAASATSRVGGSSYDVASGAPRTINELIRQLEELVGHKLARSDEPPRPGDVVQSSADIRAAAADLGWSPAIGFEEGFRLTLDWYRSWPDRR